MKRILSSCLLVAAIAAPARAQVLTGAGPVTVTGGLMIGTALASSGEGDYVASTRNAAAVGSALAPVAPPRAPVETPGVPPGMNMAWMGGYYSWSGTAYTWTRGKWGAIPQGKTAWEPARWQGAPDGYRMVPGRWR